MSTGQKLAAPAPATRGATKTRIDPEDLAAMRKALQEATEAADRGDWTRAGNELAALARTATDRLGHEEVLTRAAALRDSIGKRRRLRANRTALVSLFTAAGLVLALLAAIPVRSVRIIANVQASSVSFDGPSAWIFEDMPLREIEVTGLQTAVVDGHEKGGQGRLSLRGTSPEAQLAATGAGLLLDHLSIQSPATTLETLDGRALTLDASAAEATGQLVGQEGVRLQMSDLVPEGTAQALDDVEAPDGAVVTFAGKSIALVVNPRLRGEAPVVLARNAGVSRVRFAGRHVEDLHSSLVSGTLSLSEFKTDPITLNPGDALALEAGRRLHVTRMVFDKGFVVHLNGDVTSLRLNARQLKPSLLAWGTQHRGAVLFGGALASVLSAAWLILTRLELLRT